MARMKRWSRYRSREWSCVVLSTSQALFKIKAIVDGIEKEERVCDGLPVNEFAKYLDPDDRFYQEIIRGE